MPVAIRSVHSVATTLFEQSQPRGKGQVLIASPRPAARRQALVLGQLRQHWQPKPSTPVQTHHMTLPTRLDPEVINPDQTLGFQPSVGQTMLQVHQDASRSSLDKRSSWATALRCSSSRANIIRTELTCPGSRRSSKNFGSRRPLDAWQPGAALRPDRWRFRVEDRLRTWLCVYYTRHGDCLLLLLVGGNKSTQQKDIAKAI